MYIYAFPVEQTLAAAGAQTVAGFAGFVALSLLLTAPLAWLSWRVVECPCMVLRPRGLGAKGRLVLASTRRSE
jgi:peptidoglycan/LPS O-acetylase OafA/YrhL